ncbi:MAG: hypothetical protein MJY87_07770 [Fibrobacter sp.]|nr:hypothetical protein [Fibrobacter sp.]
MPHIFILSFLTEDQFVLDRNNYFHTIELVRNRLHYYGKQDIHLVKLEKFFAIEDRTKPEQREQSRAPICSAFDSCTNDVFLLEADGMTDLAYEKDGSFLQGKANGEEICLAKGREEAEQEYLEKTLQAAREMLLEGDSVEKVCRIQKLTEQQVRRCFS